MKLNFVGLACDANGLFCQKVATEAQFQNDLLREQNRLKSDASPFRFYPILSTGFGHRF